MNLQQRKYFLHKFNFSFSFSPPAGDQGPHVGRELQDDDGGWAADGQAGAGQPAG